MEETVTVHSAKEAASRIKEELAKVIIGQDEVIEQTLIALLADGHILLEGVPGVAKTLIVRVLAMTLSLPYSRIQFTPDLMPSDIIGTSIYDSSTGKFHLKKGPVFTSILLADEINRTPPKTQSALLEAMEERQVTVEGNRELLPVPFFVCATQNPIEFEGTYPLPEAQLDRFIIKILVDYPLEEEEKNVLRMVQTGFRSTRLENANIQQIIDPNELLRLRMIVEEVTVEEKIINFIAEIVRKTRSSSYISVGASPRAGIALLLCSKALASIKGRDFVTPDDVKAITLPVLRHRILLRPEAEIEGLSADRTLMGILETITVPR